MFTKEKVLVQEQDNVILGEVEFKGCSKDRNRDRDKDREKDKECGSSIGTLENREINGEFLF